MLRNSSSLYLKTISDRSDRSFLCFARFFGLSRRLEAGMVLAEQLVALALLGPEMALRRERERQWPPTQPNSDGLQPTY